MHPVRPSAWCALLLICGGIAVPGAARAEARPAAELIAPGRTTPLPGKGRLPRREGMASFSLGAAAVIGEGTGGEAFAALRLVEALGVGGGITIAEEGAAAFIRLDAIGLAINHWAFLGFADHVLGEGWRFGGAAVVPLRRDTYLRLSIASNLDDGAGFGIGMEHDLW